MQAIQTRYLGPSNVRGSRIKAFCAAGSLTLPYDYALNAENNHRRAADRLAEELGWIGEHYGEQHGGQIKNGDYVWISVKRPRHCELCGYIGPCSTCPKCIRPTISV